MRILTLISRRLKFKPIVQLLSVFAAFVCVLFELHLSIIQEIYSSFGKYNGAAFVQFRIIIGAILVALTGLNVLVNQRRLFKVTELRIYLVFFLYMVLIVWINRDEYAFMNFGSAQSVSALSFWSPILFKYLVFFCIGYQFVQTLNYRSVYLFFTLMAFVVVLTHVNYDTLTIDRNAYIETANKGNYLFLGDAMALCCLLILACYKSQLFRFVFALVSLVVIFLIGSRTSFVVYFGACLLYFILLFRVRYLPYVAVVVIALFIGVQQVDFGEIEDKNTRMTTIFTDYEEDNSVVSRKLFAEVGWEQIYNHPIKGEFGGQREVDIFGGKALWHNYMHNIFSYWRQFGIIAFLCLCYFLFSYIHTLRKYFKQRTSETYAVFFLVGVYTITEVIISRSFAFANAHVVFGLVVWLAFLQERKITTGGKSSDGGATRPKEQTQKRKSKRRRKTHIRFS